MAGSFLVGGLYMRGGEAMMRTETVALQESKIKKSDNRIFFRNPLYDVKTQIKNVNTGERFDAFLKNLSGSGMGLAAAAPCAAGAILEIALDLPDGFGPLKLLGRVVWSNEADISGYRAGVAILNPRFMSVSRILKLFF